MYILVTHAFDKHESPIQNIIDELAKDNIPFYIIKDPIEKDKQVVARWIDDTEIKKDGIIELHDGYIRSQIG